MEAKERLEDLHSSTDHSGSDRVTSLEGDMLKRTGQRGCLTAWGFSAYTKF